MGPRADDVLSRLTTGRWNLVVFIATACWQAQLVPHMLGGVFLAPKVGYTCKPPDNGYTITFTTYNSGAVTRNTSENCHFFANNSEGGGFVKEPCRSWDYDNVTFTNTLTTQFDLVCSSDYLRTTYESLYMIGLLVGAPIAGILADRFGRKRIFSMGVISYLIISIISCWLPSLSAILAARFLLGFLHPAGLQVGYVLALESCETRYRPVVGMLLGIGWAVGTIAWGIWAHLLRDWKWLQSAVSLPGLLILPALWFVDESPRYLIVRGQFAKAQKIFEKAANWNNVQLPPAAQLDRLMKHIQKESIIAKEAERHEHDRDDSIQHKLWLFFMNFFVLLRTPKLRRCTILIYLNFCMVAMVFYGIKLNSGNFTINPFLYMSLMGLVEVPAYAIMPPIMLHLGRKGPSMVCFFLSGIFIIGLAFVVPDSGWVATMLALISRVCVTAAFQVLCLHTVELLPTEIRLKGLTTAILIFHATTMLCPTISEKMGPGWAPSLLFGIAAFVAGLAILPLPETHRLPLPDTVIDVETTPEMRMMRPDRRISEEAEMAKLRA